MCIGIRHTLQGYEAIYNDLPVIVDGKRYYASESACIRAARKEVSEIMRYNKPREEI